MDLKRDLTKFNRRNIHTYPFKYTYSDPEHFFAPEKAALYIHVPFCMKKCKFCDYKALVGSTHEVRDAYVKAVCEEIRRFPDIPCYPRFAVDALYIGGGTPSTLTHDQIKEIVDTCKETFSFLDDAEICMEFDPSTVTREAMFNIKEIGFNRISFGVQSFSDHVLTKSNRSHSSADAIRAIHLAREAGISQFNLDLIYPLQHQTMEDWQSSLQEAIKLEPAAITAYPLEIWPQTSYGTSHAENTYETIPYEDEIRMTNAAYDILEENGFKRHSTCGYYHPDRIEHYCKFQDYYWKSFPMIGFGVSAKTVIHERAYTNVSSIHDYMERIQKKESAIDFSTKMTKRQEMLRVMIRGFKVCFIEKQYFYDRFGVSMEDVFPEEIGYLEKMGWISNLPDRIEMTRSGQVHDRNVYGVFYTEDDLRDPRDDEVMYGISMEVE